MTDPVLVGADGSEPALTAVRWAAVEAHRRGAALTVLHAYDASWPTMPGLAWQSRPADADLAQEIVAEARLAVNRLVPAITVHTEILPGDPAAALLEHSSGAALVVVGHRGRGGFTSLMLGSVSHRVTTQATVPAVVVRGRAIAFTDPVVVGADGTPGGRLAIETAFGMADARHAALLAVHAYREPFGPPAPALPAATTASGKAAATTLDDLLAPWLRRFPTVAVSTLVGPGSAARLLVGASHRAQLVVVGHGGPASLIGSVPVQLLHHADCPVMIARAR